MAFLHPRYFPFCPAIGFDAPRAFRRADFQGPFSLEQAMALYWKVKTISISGTSFGAFDEQLPFSFTFSGPLKMSDVVCPDITIFGPASIPTWGWRDNQSHRFWNTVFFSSYVPVGLASLQKNGNIVYADEAYYVYFTLILFASEGSPVRSTSINEGLRTVDTTVSLQIDDLSVPIGFSLTDRFLPSIISSFTCTTRDPS